MNKFFVFVGQVFYKLFLMFLGVAVFFGFMYFSDSHISPIEFVSNSMELSIYKSMAVSHLNDNITIEVSSLCREIPMDKQVECVVTQVSNFYNYSMHNISVRSPDDYVKYGGVCRDSSVLYDSIFRRLGWFVHYDFTVPNHVFLDITKYSGNNTIKCVVDSLTYNCQNYNG